MELLQWWNLPFVLPFVAAVGYLFLLATGTVSAGHEFEADADADADADLDHGYDHGIEHSVGHGEQESGVAVKALSFLGFGRVPLSLILMSFCFIWGFSGWAANKVFAGVLFFPFLYFWPSAFVALISSVFLTGYIAKMLAWIMPATETYVASNQDLVGKVAEVRYPITEAAGSAVLYDDFRAFQEVSCRVAPGETKIPIGSRVVLMRYDDEDGIFVVRRDAAEVRGVLKN